MTPTQRTLRYLRQEGRICGIVERFLPYAGKHGQRADLFGFIDIIVLDPIRGIIGVQSCGQAFAEHYRKITEDCAYNAMQWIQAGGAIELIGWRKVKVKRGGKAMIWQPRIKEIKFTDISDMEAPMD